MYEDMINRDSFLKWYTTSGEAEKDIPKDFSVTNLCESCKMASLGLTQCCLAANFGYDDKGNSIVVTCGIYERR